MRVLITGGEGFIGSYVKSRCKELGIETVTYDMHGNLTQDITDYDTLADLATACNPDAIIHLAGLLGTHELWDTAEDAIDVNIKGALNTARVAIAHGIKLVSIEQPHIWYNVYEATKFAARRMLTGLHYDQGLQVDFVTAHNAFGPGQAYGGDHPQKIIPTFATKAWAGEPIPIWGTGDQQANLVYAGDVADMLVERALDRHGDPLKSYQAGSTELYPVENIAKLVQGYVLELGGPPPVNAEYLPMRRGEQGGPYPQPTDDYTIPFRDWQLLATVDSYRPDDT